MNRVGCYFHYKMDIIRNLRIYNLYNIFNSDEIISKLGKLPLIYKGDMKKFDEFINILISENKQFKNFINNYFIKNKRKYFVNEDYNYSKDLYAVRSNSYIESYNKYVKNELGNKKIVNWATFINFLKNESERTKKKLIEISNQNVKVSKNKSKFGINKYKKRPKSYVLESGENNWLTTKNSSCRYDAFITMFQLSINQIYNPFINSHINFLIEIIKKILEEKNENYKFDFWRKLVESKIDIDNYNDDGFNKFGYIVQLFDIFKENIKYCVKECKRLHCNKCKRDIVLNDIILNPLIIIQKEYLNYENIDSIFIDKDLVKIYKNVPNAHKLIILKKNMYHFRC